MTHTNAEVDLPAMRVSYEQGALLEEDLAANWYEQLQRWLDEAHAAGLPEANAMVLATADDEGVPASRTVLCKGIDELGVVFYTNYASAKSRELQQTRLASVTFPWFGIQRQAHVRGTVQKASAAETEAYWRTRPRGSQLGAWASPQSRIVADREALDTALAKVERQFADTEEIPVPPHWGGWRIRPRAVEFWQGRKDRLHDRLRFRLDGETWKVERVGA